MEQKRKSFQELIKEGRMVSESGDHAVEIHSVEELKELLQQMTEDGTMLSIMVEVDGHEQ